LPTRRKALALVAATALSTLAAAAAFAGDGQPVRIVVGFPPGASADAVARLVAQKMPDTLGAPVIVENKPGAAGRIAIEAVKNAAPDGRTVLVTPVAMMAVFPSVYKSLRYDPVKDFAPVSQLTTYQFAVAVGPRVPAKTLGELVSWAKTHPNQANFASPAAGSLPHFMGVMFAKAAGLDMVHVAFKGFAPAVSALIGGQVPMLFGVASDFSTLDKAGKLHVLATSGNKRSPLFPNVPTFNEAGYKIDANGWYAMYAPAGTPADKVAQLHKAVVAALNAPDVKARLESFGMEVAGTTPAELAKIQKEDTARWAPVVKASGFNPNE
jgi:tripartite-type tricarboxylate transporter receptor subunit TctC